MKDETKGMLYGIVGVTAFGLTLPATKIAIQFLNPIFIGLGRASVAACFAAGLLFFYRQTFPDRRQMSKLIIVALGVVIGFPVFSSVAMQYVPASHGGVVVGILPLFTAMVGVFIGKERPGILFWLVSLTGSLLVIVYALQQGSDQFHVADIALLAAVISAAIGYAVGAKLSLELGGWQVICWALIVAFPLSIVPTIYYAPKSFVGLPISIYSSFFYLVLVSQLFAFFLWYKGLALGGIVRVSQAQLLQPFVTIFASVLILNEVVRLDMIIFVSLIVATVWIGKRMPIYEKV